MKSDGLLKHVLAALCIAAAIYFAFYAAIEHRRTRKGPWQVEFAVSTNGTPTLIVQQPALAITNVRITFPGETASETNVTLVFDQPRPTPYKTPFGKCLFMDTTFLPGTIVFDLFGHEIQLIPRVLTIDTREVTWKSETTIPLPASSRKFRQSIQDSRRPVK